ncbi:MAG: TAXI family TRAP transporter solute-binding subunit [Thermoanaerobaculia bacterium]
MMRRRRFLALLLLAATVFACGPRGAETPGPVRLVFSGGPEGGTFQYFSNGIAIRLSRTIAGLEVSNTASAGSLENLRRVDSGEVDFGIVYSGDTWLGRNGRLTQDPRRYENVLALAFLYGAPAHLVVLAGSGIDGVEDLAGQRVAVGGAGSGAASAAERYFTSLGLWDEMEVEFLGYSKAASALGDHLIDAFWVLAGHPNASVIQAAASNEIKLLGVADAADRAGFFEHYPFYTEVALPAGIYRGVDEDVASFQDAALWVAGRHVAPEQVHAALTEIFSAAGLAYLAKVKSTARAMSVEGALNGIVTPVHPGAARFWKEQGLELGPESSAEMPAAP